nr:MAG TPA: hypothetical protein [Caudoviricetes sp.]
MPLFVAAESFQRLGPEGVGDAPPLPERPFLVKGHGIHLTYAEVYDPLTAHARELSLQRLHAGRHRMLGRGTCGESECGVYATTCEQLHELQGPLTHCGCFHRGRSFGASSVWRGTDGS